MLALREEIAENIHERTSKTTEYTDLKKGSSQGKGSYLMDEAVSSLLVTDLKDRLMKAQIKGPALSDGVKLNSRPDYLAMRCSAEPAFQALSRTTVLLFPCHHQVSP